MLTFGGKAGMRSGGSASTGAEQLELLCDDGACEKGPAFAFEHLDQNGTGPGSMDALVNACLDQPYYLGAGALEGLKAVATIDAMYHSSLSGKPEQVADACT